MAIYLTKAAYNGMNKATGDNNEKTQLSLYRQNAKLVATIALGRASEYGLEMTKKTTTMDNSMGFAWKAIDTTKKKSKPSNATAKITLDNNLDNIKFTLTNKYYNVIAVIASNNVPATKTNLIKKLAKMINNPV